MNKGKLILTMLVLVAVVIGLATIVYSADITPTINTGSAQTFTGTGNNNNISVSIAGQGNISGVILYFRTSSTGAWIQIDNISNSANANRTLYYLRFYTQALADTTTGQLNVTVRNYTMTSAVGNISSALVSVNVDNEAPNVTYTLSRTRTDADNHIDYTCSYTDQSTNNTNLITLTMPDLSTRTYSSLVDVFKFGSVGAYSTTCQITDGQGQATTSESQSITIVSGADNYVIVTPAGTSGTGTTAQQTATKSKNTG